MDDIALRRITSYKAVQRECMEGGPLRQPQWYALEAPTYDEEPSVFALDSHFPYISENRLLDVRSAAAMVLDREAPMVFKQNASANGEYIFFLEPHPWRATMRAKQARSDQPGAPMVATHLIDNGATYEYDASDNVLTCYLGDSPSVEDISAVLLHGQQRKKVLDTLFVDSGCIEELIPGLQPGGKSFETRHVVEHHYSELDVTHFASRTGGTSYFSNQTNATPGTTGTSFEREIFSPIELLCAPVADRETLLSRATTILESTYSHFMAAAEQRGFKVGNTSALEVDLMWEMTEDALVPWLVELQYLDTSLVKVLKEKVTSYHHGL